MWIGERDVDLHVVIDGKQVDNVVHLGRTVLEDGGGCKQARCVRNRRGTSLYILVWSICSDR